MDSLLNPRVIQLVKYPGGFYKKGHIYDCKTPTYRSQYHPVEWYREFPEVFRELNWYEYRKEEELPKYLILLTLRGANKIIKVKKYYLNCDNVPPYALAEDGWTVGYLQMCLPTTKEEYESYLAVSQKPI